ncbi:MAG: flagellin lysine-N-methylase [Lachnoclostridium sp.]
MFRQDSEKRCAFLNDDNLCDLYTELGKDSLCKTCSPYPRHVEEFEGVREITLSVSCPEVAKILL